MRLVQQDELVLADFQNTVRHQMYHDQKNVQFEAASLVRLG